MCPPTWGIRDLGSRSQLSLCGDRGEWPGFAAAGIPRKAIVKFLDDHAKLRCHLEKCSYPVIGHGLNMEVWKRLSSRSKVARERLERDWDPAFQVKNNNSNNNQKHLKSCWAVWVRSSLLSWCQRLHREDPGWVNLVPTAGTRWLQPVAPDRAAEPGWDLREHTTWRQGRVRRQNTEWGTELHGGWGGAKRQRQGDKVSCTQNRSPKSGTGSPKASTEFYQIIRYAPNFISDLLYISEGFCPPGPSGSLPLTVCGEWMADFFSSLSLVGWSG